jgi:hypothetical protein
LQKYFILFTSLFYFLIYMIKQNTSNYLNYNNTKLFKYIQNININYSIKWFINGHLKVKWKKIKTANFPYKVLHVCGRLFAINSLKCLALRPFWNAPTNISWFWLWCSQKIALPRPMVGAKYSCYRVIPRPSYMYPCIKGWWDVVGEVVGELHSPMFLSLVSHNLRLFWYMGLSHPVHGPISKSSNRVQHNP